MIRFRHKGDFWHAEHFFKRASKVSVVEILKRYGQEGVRALASATPVDSGATAAAWDYEIEQNGDSYSIYWTNSNVNDGVPIAVILQYGHGTGTGGYVQGIDYINPAMQPVFERIANDAWEEVISS